MPTQQVTPVSEILARIQSRQAKIGIIGLGYVGLPLGLLFSEEKFQVLGFDIDATKVNALNSGNSYIHRILPAEIQQAREKGFSATSDYTRLKEVDAVIIAVPTPLNEYHEPDLSYITATGDAIAPNLQANHLVVLESTTYPGTTEEVLLPILEKGNKLGLKASRDGVSNDKVFFLTFRPSAKIPATPAWRGKTFPK